MPDRKRRLSGEICRLLGKHNASNIEGIEALTEVLVVMLLDSQIGKQRALELLSTCWDALEEYFHHYHDQEHINGR
jgi:hypothetical protein